MRINQVKAVNTGTLCKLEKIILVHITLINSGFIFHGCKRSVTQIITMISDQSNSEYHVMFMYHCQPHFIVYHCI